MFLWEKYIISFRIQIINTCRFQFIFRIQMSVVEIHFLFSSCVTAKKEKHNFMFMFCRSHLIFHFNIVFPLGFFLSLIFRSVLAAGPKQNTKFHKIQFNYFFCCLSVDKNKLKFIFYKHTCTTSLHIPNSLFAVILKYQINAYQFDGRFIRNEIHHLIVIFCALLCSMFMC